MPKCSGGIYIYQTSPELSESFSRGYKTDLKLPPPSPSDDLRFSAKVYHFRRTYDNKEYVPQGFNMKYIGLVRKVVVFRPWMSIFNVTFKDTGLEKNLDKINTFCVPRAGCQYFTRMGDQSTRWYLRAAVIQTLPEPASTTPFSRAAQASPSSSWAGLSSMEAVSNRWKNISPGWQDPSREYPSSSAYSRYTVNHNCLGQYLGSTYVVMIVHLTVWCSRNRWGEKICRVRTGGTTSSIPSKETSYNISKTELVLFRTSQDPGEYKLVEQGTYISNWGNFWYLLKQGRWRCPKHVLNSVWEWAYTWIYFNKFAKTFVSKPFHISGWSRYYKNFDLGI